MLQRIGGPAVASQDRAARGVALLVAGAVFMEMLDGTVIATALPSIARSFGTSAVAMNLGMTAYLLSLAAFIPISGWVADRFGGRTVFAGAIALFTVASLLCGLSSGLWSFTAARLLQGMGGAAMVPVGRLIVLRMTKKEDLMQAMNTIVWPGLVAPVLGPPLGGFIVLHLSWAWIFYLNIPLGIGAILLTLWLVPNDRAPLEGRPLDLIGFLLSSGALALIVYGTDALGNSGTGRGRALATIVAGLLVGTAAVRHFRRHPTPLLDLSALRIPTFAVGVWGGSLLRIAIGALPFLLPLLFQVGFGFDPLRSGMLLLFVFAGNLAMKLFAVGLLRRFGFRTMMIGNGLLAAAAIAACALLAPTTPLGVTAAILFAGGAFRSLQFSALAMIQFADVAPDRLTDANTLSIMLQQLMMGLGVVVGAALLNAGAALRGRPPGSPDLTDFKLAIGATALIALAGLFDSFMLDPNAGRAIIDR